MRFIRFWRLLLDTLDTIYLLQFLIKLAGGGAVAVWLASCLDSYYSLPIEAKIFALIAVFAIAFLLVGLFLRILRIPKSLIERRLTKQIRLNKTINNILARVEAMDNRVFDMLPQLEEQLTKDRIEALFTYNVFIFLATQFAISMQRGVEKVAEFLDENHIGLCATKKDEGYQQQEKALEQSLRLKSVSCRNAAYDFIRFSYGLNSTLYLGRKFKAIGKLEALPIFLRLPVSLKLRELENKRQQGIGNMLTRLALKLEGRCK